MALIRDNVFIKLAAIVLVITAMPAQSNFDATVAEYGGPQAFDITLVQDCSVLNNGSKQTLDKKYNAKLCSMEDGSALSGVAELLRSKGFNSVRVALSTTGAQLRPTDERSKSEIQTIHANPSASDEERAAYIATLRRIARGIDVDAEAHELNAKELASLGLAENHVVIFMVTDGTRVSAGESVAQGVATTLLTGGWLTAWQQSDFFSLATAIDSNGAVAWYGYRGPYSVSGPDTYKELILSVFEI